MENLKEIIAKEVEKPKELLKRTKKDIEYILEFVQALEKEVRTYTNEVAGGALFKQKAAKAKARLLERKENLQTLIEVLRQTIGEEWDAVRDDWPEEYIGNIREIDNMISSRLQNEINDYGQAIEEAVNVEQVKSVSQSLRRFQEELQRLMRLVAVEEAMFARDLQLAINNHVGKDFKQHATVYAGEIISTWNNYYRSKWKKEEVEVSATTEDIVLERVLYFPPFKQTKLVLTINFFDGNGENNFRVIVKLWYDLVDRIFKLQFAQMPKHRGEFGAPSYSNEQKFDSINDAFVQLARWFRK